MVDKYYLHTLVSRGISDNRPGGMEKNERQSTLINASARESSAINDTEIAFARENFAPSIRSGKKCH